MVCLTVGGFLLLLWEILQYLGVTECPLYYGRKCEEDGMSKCEVHLHIIEHLLSIGSQVRCIPAIGRELSDTCQIVACQALTNICQDYEAKIDNIHARFFPIVDQTTPIWRENIEALEKDGQRTPEYTIVAPVKYLHPLDILYEDQQRELKKWTAKAKDAEAEL